jgi:hypothetical protein
MALSTDHPTRLSPARLFVIPDRTLERLARLAATLLAALVLLLIGFDVLAIVLRVPFDPREGWNAYLAHAAASGQSLYPTGSSLWFDNYPPLSFFVVGGLGRLIGDDILAGRIIALSSTFATATLIVAIARHMRCSRPQALLAGLLFLASPWLLTKFATIDDPQMLGMALSTAGLAIALWRAPIAAGALLMTLAAFVKPVFVIQPLALFVWLALYERKRAFAFAAWCLLFGIAGLAIADKGLHANILGHLFLARSYSLSRALSHPGQWFITGLVPLAATLSLLRYRQDRDAIFCAIYALAGLVLGIVFSSGDGVGGNLTLDASIAVSLGFAVFLNRASLTQRTKSALRLVCLVPFAIVVIISAFGGWSSGPSIPRRFAWARIARADIVFFERRPRPALCEMESLCYWAGKQRLLDVWGFAEAFAASGRPPGYVEMLLETHYFSVIQLQPRTQLAMSSPLFALLKRNYRVDHRDVLGIFYVPRAQ